ncbi:hypothetical protein ACN28S_07780 [Cystobacter fuscus]
MEPTYFVRKYFRAPRSVASFQQLPRSTWRKVRPENSPSAASVTITRTFALPGTVA